MKQLHALMEEEEKNSRGGLGGRKAYLELDLQGCLHVLSTVLVFLLFSLEHSQMGVGHSSGVQAQSG